MRRPVLHRGSKSTSVMCVVIQLSIHAVAQYPDDLLGGIFDRALLHRERETVCGLPMGADGLVGQFGPSDAVTCEECLLAIGVVELVDSELA